MKAAYFKSLLFSAFLFISGHLFAGPAEFAVKDFYFVLYSKTFVETEKFTANLLEFEATFRDHRLPKQKGFVDADGRYVILGSKIITSQTKIKELLANSTLLPHRFNIFNLLPYELNSSPNKQILFVDKKKRYAVLGGQVTNPITFHGTFQVANTFIPVDLANYLYSQRYSTGSFLQGSAKAPKTIFVYNEPNCPICRDLYDGLKPFVDSGELSIHWNPITFIHPNSRGKAWAILDGDVPGGADFDHTPAGALAYNEEFFMNPDEGGIPPTRHPSYDATVILNRNEQFFFVAGFTGTPFIIFKNIQGQAQYLQGLPTNFTDFVNNLFVNTGNSD